MPDVSFTLSTITQSNDFNNCGTLCVIGFT